LLVIAYFLEVGLVLLVAPWTAFWEQNVFVIASPRVSGVLLSPWLRGAMSGVGVVTFGAGLLDVIGLFVHRGSSDASSASAPR
jgi:hypothetical protein